MIASTTDPHWAPRPVLALGLRLVQYGLPLLGGWVAAEVVARQLVGHVPSLVMIAAGLVAAVGASLVISRLTIRLAPLAVLFKMTMIFPDHAPSRLRVARRSTSAEDIRRRLASESADEQDAAVTMLSLVTALGRHDKHTRGHSERVRLFCDLLSRELGLSEADSGRLRWAALIHDIGKLEVAVSVLNKAGRLNSDEWAQIRMHPEAGARLARPLAEWLGPWFSGIAEHHERYDGSGYPMGLSGEQISPAGRAVAVVDAYETMTASRSYKAAVTAVAARAELTRCAGTHFDPAMVRAFLGIALPRLLWSVGPLAFLVNMPFLRWIGDGGTRLAQASSTAVNAASVSAVVVAAGTVPALASEPPTQPTARQGVHQQGQPGTHPSSKVKKHPGRDNTVGHEPPVGQPGSNGPAAVPGSRTGQRPTALPTSATPPGPQPAAGPTTGPPPGAPTGSATNKGKGPAKPTGKPSAAKPTGTPKPKGSATGTPKSNGKPTASPSSATATAAEGSRKPTPQAPKNTAAPTGKGTNAG